MSALNNNNPVSVNRHLDNLQKLPPEQPAFFFKRKTAINKDIVTDHAFKCLDDIATKESQLKFASLKRYAAVNATFLAHFAIPVSAAGAYVAWNGVENTIADVTTVVYKAGSTLMDTIIKTVGALSSTNQLIAGGSTALVTLNEATGAVGGRPITRTTKWIIGGLALATIWAYIEWAKTNKDMVNQDYVRSQEGKKTDIERIYQKMHDHLQTVFNDDSNALMLAYYNVKNDPVQLYELQQYVLNLPDFTAELGKLPLSSSDVHSILYKISEAKQTILDQKIAAKSPTTESDNEYNAKLLTSPLPINQDTCIPPNALKHLELAKNNTLGLAFTAKHYINSALSGICSAVTFPLAAAAATYAHTPTYEATTAQLLSINVVDRSPLTPTAIAAGAVTALTSIGFGAGIAKLVSNRYSKTKTESNQRFTKHTDLAKQDILNFYNGIADYFTQKHQTAKCLTTLKVDAETITSKLPSIHKEILKCNIAGLKPEDVTEKLRSVLASI